MTLTDYTVQYWLRIFNDWAEGRLLGPQYDEAHAVLKACGLRPQECDDEDEEENDD